MRIRGAKSELEDAGLDTEGMVESTSKLRDIILSMTGVDIMIDEDTFKSTYDIIKEIGVVWKDLSDIDQASLLETLAGKRQASIVAAALNNYTRLDEVLRLSTDSAGESAKAQEEVAKGISYAFEQVKIAFTELSEAFMSSDFLKAFAKSAQTALEVVTKLIKTFGTLPTLLGGVALGASFKNFGIFKTISSDVNAAGLQLTIFNQKWSTIKANLTADNATLGQRVKGVFSGMFSIRDAELAALQRYSVQLNQVTTDEQRLATQTRMLNTVQSSGSKMMQARVVEMNSLNNALKAGAISQEQYNARMQVLTTATQTTTGATAALNVGLKALKLTLNTMLTIGITMGISALINGISKLANASKEAEEKAREARDAAVERAKSYMEEADSMTDLQDEYIKLVTTTSDLTTEKERLLSIQDKLNDGISDQKEQVDLLNGSLSETLRLTREQKVEDANRALAEQAPYYKEAVKDLQDAIEFSGELSNKWNDISRLDWGTTAFSKIQAIAGQAVSPTYKAAEHRGDIYISGFTIDEGSLRENLEVLNKIISEYSVWDDANSEIITKLAETRDKYQKIYDAQSEIVKAYEEAQSIIDGDKAFAKKSEEYYSLIDNAQKAMQSFTELKKSGASPEEIRQSEQLLEQLQSQLIELVGNDVEARRTIASIFGSIDDGANQVEKDLRALQSSVDSLTTKFTELRKTFEDDVKDIDKIRSAIQDLAEGKTISRKDAWEIFDLDTEGILTDIRLVNGEYKLSASQLTSLMDSRIAKQKESIEAIKAEAEAEVQSAKVAVQLAEVRLKTATVNSAADVEYYKQYQKQLAQAQESLKAAESTLRNSNRMLADIENYGGDIVDYSKVLDAKTKEIDKNLKAQKADIDTQIKSIKVVVDQLEQEKDVLEQQKDALNEQKDSLEEIVKQYKDVASEVKSLTDEEKDALAKERDERKEYWSKQIDDSKEYYNAQIDALKEEHEAKKDIESLEKKKLDIQEKQLAVQEKQRELEEAREKRVRTYSASRGWTFMGDQDAIATAQKNFDEAQKNLADAQKAYQDEIEEQAYDAQIKNLEKLRDAQNKLFEEQRDAEIEGLEQQIKAVEDYAKAWTKATEDVMTAEEELIAQEVLGSDWREKIANKDLSIIENFKTNFNRYNSQLKTITDIELKNLEKSIKAKEADIKTRKAEIDAWEAQKTEIENAATAMKESLEEYYNNLSIANEKIIGKTNGIGDAFNELVVTVWNAKENINVYMQEMIGNTDGIKDKMVDTAETISDSFKKMYAIMEISKLKTSVEDALNIGLGGLFGGTKRYANGGVNSDTGYAWLDGTSQRPEVVLNNADATKLYNFIHNSNFANYKPVADTQPTNATARFDGATFVFNGVQNPQQFSQQMEIWLNHEQTRSRVNGVGN